jgi:prevent-host-death family protein
MATTVNMHEAKTHFSKLVERVENGEDVIVASAGRPRIRMTQLEPALPKRRLGLLEGLYTVPEDIKTPFEKEIHEMFYGDDEGS